MNKLIRYIQNYLVYGFLPVVGLLIWSILSFFLGLKHNIAENNLFVRTTHEILSYNLMLWVVTFMLFMVSIVIIPAIREKTLRRLANLQERDEREEYITGKAARSSYVATLSLTLFLLFFSIFNFHYSKLEKSSSGKPGHSVGIGFRYHLFAETVTEKQPVKGLTPIFDSTSYALSGSTLLLILLGWQLLIFNLSARNLSK